MMISLRIMKGGCAFKQYNYLRVANAIPVSNIENLNVEALKNVQVNNKK